MASADELYLTFTILEADKSGGPLVVWFNRFYIGAFVALFAVIVINILIAIFITAYECMKVSLKLISDSTIVPLIQPL